LSHLYPGLDLYLYLLSRAVSATVDALDKWGIQSLIGMLPTFLHLALILFLAGLIIFLIPLSTTMAYAVGAISVTVAVLYLRVTVLPLFAVQCSYKTTLTHLLYSDVQVYRLIRQVYAKILWKEHRAASGIKLPGLKDREYVTAYSNEDSDVAPLAWLYHYTSNPSARNVLICSLGALPPRMSEKLGRVAYASDVLWQIEMV
jgi:hypothetical protein